MITLNPSTKSFSGSHTFSNSEVYSISVTAVDSDDLVSVAQYTTAVFVGLGVLDGTLYVIGTSGKDEVDIKLKGNGYSGQVINRRGEFDKNGNKKNFDLDFARSTIDILLLTSKFRSVVLEASNGASLSVSGVFQHTAAVLLFK